MMRPSVRRCRDLIRACDAIAITEFALVLPIFIILMAGGIEVANYATVRMKVSQLALHVADNAARIGEGSQLQAKRVNEAQIVDLLQGAALQSGALDLANRGRVVLSSLEPMATPNPAPARYRIRWQRCFGAEAHTRLYGVQGDQNLVGMGPAANRIIAMEDSATMFVELNYRYRPLIVTDVVSFGEFTEIAAMPVRDRRDRTGGNNGVYAATGVTPLTC